MCPVEPGLFEVMVFLAQGSRLLYQQMGQNTATKTACSISMWAMMLTNTLVPTASRGEGSQALSQGRSFRSKLPYRGSPVCPGAALLSSPGPATTARP